MVFWACGDQLVVLVNFHKTTVTTHRLICGLVSGKERKRNYNTLIQGLAYSTMSDTEGPHCLYLML